MHPPPSTPTPKFVLVATPCYGGSVTSAYFLSVLNTLSTVSSVRPDIRLAFYTLGNESLVTRARNTCVAHFLSNEAFTHLFFIDADIEFTPATFLRVLDIDKDVACACYPQKTVRWESVASFLTKGGWQGDARDLAASALNYNVTINSDNAPRSVVPENGFMRVDYCATGFMVIKRQVFDAMRTAYPDQHYVNETLSDPAMRPHNWLFFDCIMDPETRQYLSEDYAFCKKWRAIGGQVWADMVSPLGHVGTHKFEGTVLDTMGPDARHVLLRP